MLTGDRISVATSIGERLGIDIVRAELLPTKRWLNLTNLRLTQMGRALRR